jgi:hypothetical protein
MNKINGQKLLPSSKALTVSQKKLSSSQLVPYKNIKQQSSEKVKKEEKKTTTKKETLLGNVISIKRSVLKIEKLLGNRNALLLKENKNVEKENKDKQRKEREEKLEQKKEKKVLDTEKPKIPGVGIVDYIKNFLKWVIIGRAFMLFSKFIPNIISFTKRFKFLYDIFKTITGAVFNGLVSFIEWSDKAGKKLREIAGSLGGEPFQKAFDNFGNALTTFTNLALIAGMATMGGSDLGVGDALSPDKPDSRKSSSRKPNSPRITQSGGKPAGRPSIRNPFRKRPQITSGGSGTGRPRVTTSKGRTARTPRSTTPKITGSGGRLAAGAGKLGAKTLLRSIRPLLAGMIIGGLIDFGLSVALGENPGRAAFGAVGGTLLGLIGGALGGPFAAFTAIGGGMLGDWAGRKLYDVFFGNKKPSKTNPQKKNNGGSIRPKTGQSIKPKRSVPKKPNIKLSSKITSKKSQPGKDVGGEKAIQKLFPDPSRKLTVSEWNFQGYAGKYSDYEQQYEKQKNKPNPFKALTKVSETVATAPFIGRLLKAPIDAALGEKPDKLAFRSFSDSISFISNTLATTKVSEAVGIIRNNLKAFAEGGEIPSRELVSMRTETNYGDIFQNIFGKDIENSFNKSLDTIKKEVDKRFKQTAEDQFPGSEGGEYGDGLLDQGLGAKAGGSQELRDEVIKAAAQLGIDAPSLLGAILAESGGDPSKTNQFGCTGLIQFCPGPSAGQAVIGKSGDQLRKMSIKQQMPYVVKYLKSVGIKRGMSGFDIYSAIHAGRPGGNLTDANGVTTRGYYESNVKPLIDKARSERRLIAGAGVITADKIYPLDPSQGRDTSNEPGIDFTYKGGKTLALYPGKVTAISSQYNSSGSGYGNYVLVESTDPNTGRKFTTLYAHFGNGKIYVRKGDTVQSGSPLGAQPNRNIKGHFTGSGSGEHTSADFYEPDGRTRYRGANKLIDQILNSFSGKAPYPTQISQPTQASTPASTPGQKPEGKTGTELYEEMMILQKPVVRTFKINGNVYTERKGGVYTRNGKSITKKEFDSAAKSQSNWWDNLNPFRPTIKPPEKANIPKGGPGVPDVLAGGNKQGGGYVDMNYKSINKSNMINDYDPLDDSEQIVYIQPVIIREQVSVPQKNLMTFPGNTTLNSVSAKQISLSR